MVVMENISKQSLADRESAIKTLETEIEAVSRLKDSVALENLTEASEMGPTVTQYTLREFQREGSFKVVRPDDAAIEVHGVIRKMMRLGIAYDRARGMRASEYRYEILADVSFVDRRKGKVLVERKGLNGETTFLTQNDLLTGQKNAAARIAQDLARQIVNEALALPLKGNRKGTGAVEGVQK